MIACEPNQKPVANVDLKVNGERVKLNNFVQDFISQTVTGMVKSLRGVGDIETIDLNISKKTKNSQTQLCQKEK